MTRSQVNNNELAERCEYNSGLLVYGYLSRELGRYYTRDTNREIFLIELAKDIVEKM